MPEWSAEVTVDAAVVTQLLTSQFPALRPTHVRLLAEGWDNSVWLVDEIWAFRFPRRSIAIPGIEREMAVLPSLAPHLPLPVPVPTFLGRPGRHFGWPFFGSRLLAGREAAEAALADEDRLAVAPQLGRFLRALHAPSLAATLAVELPHDPLGRADMAVRVPRTRSRLKEVERLGLWEVPVEVHALLDRAIELPRSSMARLVHGDLHARHVLVSGSRVSGIIDWGDLCQGDPSVDLQLYWSLLPPAARPAFEEEYGPIPGEQLTRARVLAFFLSATLAIYARDQGLSWLETEAIGGLRRATV